MEKRHLDNMKSKRNEYLQHNNLRDRAKKTSQRRITNEI